MSAVIVIPARHASTRLPGKPLLRQTGKYLIQHVYERACQARRAKAVLVATDDPRIVAAVESFGGRVVLTRRDHPSGTDRVAEVARQVDADILVNLQGDEPLIEPASLDLTIGLLENDPEADMATLACPIHFARTVAQSQLRQGGLRRSRAGRSISAAARFRFVRDGKPDFTARPARFLQHIGLYAYRRSFLLRYRQHAPGRAGDSWRSWSNFAPWPWAAVFRSG